VPGQNEAKAAKAKKANEAKPTRVSKLMVLFENAPFGRKLDGTRAASGSPVGKDGKVTMPCSATKSKPQAMSFEDGAKGNQSKRGADFDYEVAMSKFRELQAANTVLWGETEELKKYISDEGRRFEITGSKSKRRITALSWNPKSARAALIFQIVKGVVPALEQEVHTAISPCISPFKKQKSPANTILLRPGLLRASTFASERQGDMQDAPIHPFSELYGPRRSLVSDSFNP
jgi:hypothetical protein